MKKRYALAPIFLALSLQQAHAEENNFGIDTRAIEGTDPQNRVEIIPDGFTNRIGRIEFGESSICTGTLISDYHVLTADHCTEDEDLETASPDGYMFYAGYSNGEYAASSKVREIIAPNDTSTNGFHADHMRFSFNDIAILVLENPLGRTLGYEEVRTTPLPALSGNAFFPAVQIGYNTGYGDMMSGDVACSLQPHFLNTQLLSSLCRVSGGDSGSPQFVWLENAETGDIERQIVGVTSEKRGHGSSATYTYASETIQNLDLPKPE